MPPPATNSAMADTLFRIACDPFLALQIFVLRWVFELSFFCYLHIIMLTLILIIASCMNYAIPFSTEIFIGHDNRASSSLTTGDLSTLLSKKPSTD